MEQTKKYRVTFSKPIDSISGTAISDESVVEVKLPKTLNYASSNTFSGCSSLEAITVAERFKRNEGEDFIEAVVNGAVVKFGGLSEYSGSTNN